MSATQQTGIFQQSDKGDFLWPQDNILCLTVQSLPRQWPNRLKN
jgi:hypothetical protein